MVNCNQQQAQAVLCVKKEEKPFGDQVEFFPSKVDCKRTEVHSGAGSNQTGCFSFMFTTLANVRENKKLLRKSNTVTDMSNLQFVFDAVSAEFAPMFVLFPSGLVHLHSYQRVFNTYRYYEEKTHSLGIGWVARLQPEKEMLIGLNLFLCNKTFFRSYGSVCQPFLDCKKVLMSQTSQNCVFSATLKGRENISPFQNELFYRQKSGHLGLLVSNENIQQNHFQGNYSSCSSAEDIFCSPGISSCFKISDICTYRVSPTGSMLSCSKGEHLQSCGAFKCSQGYKCLGYYCIDWNYVCDGKWDCPGGTDEPKENFCQDKWLCRNMLKCKTTGVCVHKHHVCDKRCDCPSNCDDEILCVLNDVMCPSFCQCLALAMVCAEGQMSVISGIFQFVVITFFKFYIDFKHLQQHFLFKNNIVIRLNIRCCKLTQPDLSLVLRSTASLVFVDFSMNHLNQIQQEDFSAQCNLRSINLSSNYLEHIDANSFACLSQLGQLDLSHSLLQSVSRSWFYTGNYAFGLMVLYLQNSSLEDIHLDTFSSLSVSILVTDDNRICCVKPVDSYCTRTASYQNTCRKLLSAVHQVCFLIISLALVLTSMGTVLWFKSPKKPFESICLSQGLLGILGSVYYCTLCVFHWVFGSGFILKQQQWRQSHFCLALFLIDGVFVTFHPLLMTFIGLCRLMVVIYPMTSKFKQKAFVERCLQTMSGVVISFILLTCGAEYFTALEEQIDSSFCSSYIFPKNASWVLKINTISACIICILSVLLMILFYVNVQEKAEKSSAVRCGQKPKSKPLALKMNIVVSVVPCGLSYIVCSVSYIVALLHLVNQEPLIWVKCLIIPGNTVFHCILFAVKTKGNKEDKIQLSPDK